MSLLKTRLISPYQHTGVKWLLARERASDYPGGFLCDEMGLGKTVQLLATMCYNPKPRTLIIVPKSILSQWSSEVKKFTPHMNVYIYDGSTRFLTDMSMNNLVIICSYAISRDEELHKYKWDRLILDEAHEVRNPKTKTSISIAEYRADIRWLVTGTPVFNSMKDFVTLCGILGVPKSSVQCFKENIRAQYLLRRTKDDLGERLKLPPCDFQNIELEMCTEELDLYRECFTACSGRVHEIMAAGAEGHNQMEILECFLRVRQVMAWPQLYLNGIAKKEERAPEKWCGKSSKMVILLTLIKSHPKEKSIVFTQFTGELARIKELLVEENIKVFVLDGQTEQELREYNVNQFKKTQGACVFLIQIKAGGVGLNLQEATRVYITTPAWNPATEMQAIARAHRTGQTQKVIVRKLIYIGTEELPSIEQSIMDLQGHKAAITADVLNDQKLVGQIPVINSKISVRKVAKLFSV
jgi:SNF2 family DNA or RNA helicase